MPTVSIVTPCYNASRYIGETIRSVQRQTFPDWELVVVDDGSCDASAGIVQEFAVQDARVRLVRQSNQGQASARNTGFAACSPDSQFLVFLDADDCLEGEMLARLTSYLIAHHDVDMVYCGFHIIDSEGNPAADTSLVKAQRYTARSFGLTKVPIDVPETTFVSLYLHWCGALPSGTLIRRTAYEATTGWDPAFRRGAEDTDLFLQIALRSPVHFLPDVLLRYRRYQTQHSRNLTEASQGQEQLCRKWENMTGLTLQEQHAVRRAILARKAWYLPCLWWEWGTDHVRNGETLEGIKCYARAVKRFIGYRLAMLAPDQLLKLLVDR